MNDTYLSETIWLNLLSNAKRYYKGITEHDPSNEIISIWERMSEEQFKEFTMLHLRQVWLFCVVSK